MAQKPKKLVIIGGGTSIKEGIEKGLWDKLAGRFVIGTNYSFNYYPKPTCQCYVDRDFYKKQNKNMEGLQLVIGQEVIEKNVQKMLNTHYIKCAPKYKRDLKGGIYKASLVGLYALSLGIYLLEEGEIFLLGYDYGEARQANYKKPPTSPQELNKITLRDKKNRPLTHFYQEELNHRGIGKINYYNAKNRATNDFKVYKKDAKVKIYNVSLNTKIPHSIFPQISYDTFFKKLDEKTYCQLCLKHMILQKIKGLEWNNTKRSLK